MSKDKKKNGAQKGKSTVQIGNILKNKIKNNGYFIVGAIICFFAILIHAKSAGHYVDFSPINGTFQNFNPVRRLLAGQIPYKDFQDYLGMGHLYLGSVFTLLFGGSFKSSLEAFSFLTLAGFSAIVFVVSWIVFSKKEYAISLTNILLVFIIIRPMFFINSLVGTEEIRDALLSALTVGNSARFVRGLIFPVSCGLFILGKKIIDKRFSKYGDLKYIILAGIVAGFSFAWSNDYGIGCWVCIAVMTFWYSFTLDRKLLYALKNMLTEIGISLCSIFLFVEIFTLGHFENWFKFTFGTGGYQTWYFNSQKSYYLWDLDTSFVVVLQAGICIYFLVMMLIRHNDDINERSKRAALAYANMVGFCVIQEYKILSGEDSREVAFTIFFATVFLEAVHIIFKAIKEKRLYGILNIISVITALSMLVSMTKGELYFNYGTDKDGAYVEELGGYLTELEDDLIATKEYIGDNRVFATYASAQEVVNGTFQVSGTDYIIHVLGDSQRAKYLEAFTDKEFRYAATIKESFNVWEYWNQRANWFFYRELYKNWHPVYANSYEMYWEKNITDNEHVYNEDISLTVEPVDDSTIKIIISSDSKVNGIADVYIDYSVDKRKDALSLMNINRMLYVKNTGTVYADQPICETNFLRDKSAEYIPVPVVNGYGEVTLEASPKTSTYLKFNGCSCETIYTVTSDFAEAIYTGDNMLCIALTEKNQNEIAGVSDVVYGGKRYTVESVSQDVDRIYVKLDGTVEESDSNMVELIRTYDGQ